ncbi:DUF429 domain-containing protein [Methylobacterium organophilum]|uniref:DUF429 domain-containing protein n=1 Tax=Methylobacterium organophilum TaxID=410 RepID=UPI001F12A78A|nr:DUF429 domain-containing protein [Methylobacterium organophilum]UMY17515.1 DUF429 domain-containing protein [Methylobacterium organophilum]
MARWIAGLDGCRGAWAGVLLDLDAPERFRVARFAQVAEVLDGAEAPIVVGIDVPIGLPARTASGRSADRAARLLLGKSRSSVFPVPPRSAVEAGSYEEAKRLARLASDPPRAFSIQCWNILPYIRTVDALLRARPELRARLYEVHPEVAFFRLNGDRALAASKKRAEGAEQRRGLLREAGLPKALVASAPPPGIGRDDHLDALAGLVVARDIAEGRATRLPPEQEHDSHGLPVVIWAPARRGAVADAACGT